MYGVVAVHQVAHGVHLDIALSLVAVGVDDQVYRPVRIGCDAQDGGVAQGRQLGLEVLVVQSHTVVVGMGLLVGMGETGGALLGLQAQRTAQGCHGERAVVLRAAAHNPMAVAEALQRGVLIIIRCDTFFLRVLRLWGPEVLTVGHEDGRQGLSVFLTALAEHTGGLGVGLCRTHHRVEGIELAEVFQVVDALVQQVLHTLPGIGVGIALRHVVVGDVEFHTLSVEHELHDDGVGRVDFFLVEQQLEVGGHGNDSIHQVHTVDGGNLAVLGILQLPVVGLDDAQEGQQTVERCVVTEAEGGGRTLHGQCPVGLGLDIFPQREGGTGGDLLVGGVVAVADGHPQVVGVVDGSVLRIGEQAEQGVLYLVGEGFEVESYVLKGRGHGVHLTHQLQGFVHLSDILEELVQEAVGRHVGGHLRAAFQVLHLWRGIGDPVHIGGVGLHVQVEHGLELAQPPSEGFHTLHATSHHTGSGLHVVAGGKHLGEVPIHPFGDALVLLHTEGTQLTAVALGVLPHLTEHLLDLLAQRG